MRVVAGVREVVVRDIDRADAGPVSGPVNEDVVPAVEAVVLDVHLGGAVQVDVVLLRVRLARGEGGKRAVRDSHVIRRPQAEDAVTGMSDRGPVDYHGIMRLDGDRGDRGVGGSVGATVGAARLY